VYIDEEASVSLSAFSMSQTTWPYQMHTKGTSLPYHGHPVPVHEASRNRPLVSTMVQQALACLPEIFPHVLAAYSGDIRSVVRSRKDNVHKTVNSGSPSCMASTNHRTDHSGHWKLLNLESGIWEELGVWVKSTPLCTLYTWLCFCRYPTSFL
jgi:hypothetical protein